MTTTPTSPDALAPHGTRLQAEPAARGAFISFEGIDGSGKTTQVASLAAGLRNAGVPVRTVRPDDTRVGQVVRGLLLEHGTGAAVDPWAEALLFFAGRAQLLREVILPDIAAGVTVIADRYTDSTLAYQGGGRGLPLDDLLQLHAVTCAGVWPDLTIYLDVPVPVAAARQRDQQLPLDRFEVAPERFHAAVRDAFDELARRDPKRIVRVDANRAPGLVAKEVLDLVRRRTGVVSASS